MHKIRHNPVWTVLVFCRWWSVNFGKYLHWMYFVWMEAMKKDYRRITSRDGCQTAWVARIWWYFHRFLSHQKETWRRFQPFFTGRQTASICGVGNHIMMFFSVPKPDQSRWTALWHEVENWTWRIRPDTLNTSCLRRWGLIIPEAVDGVVYSSGHLFFGRGRECVFWNGSSEISCLLTIVLFWTPSRLSGAAHQAVSLPFIWMKEI